MTGSPDAAYDDAATVLVELRDTAPLLAVSALIVMGQASFDRGDAARAADHYRDAVAVLSGIGSDRRAAECWFELGVILDDLGLESEARDAYRSAAASTGIIPAYGLVHRLKQT